MTPHNRGTGGRAHEACINDWGRLVSRADGTELAVEAGGARVAQRCMAKHLVRQCV